MSLVQAHFPSIVFLCETRQSKNKMKRLRARLGLRGFDGLDSVGLSGGLAMYWHESLSIEIKSSSSRYIDAQWRSQLSGKVWQLPHLNFNQRY